MEPKVVKLPSGAELKISLCSIDRADALFEAVMAETKGVGMKDIKDFACVFYSSAKIKSCVWECMKSCTYNGQKISQDTFEPAEARQDKPVVLFEVAQETLAPFMKSLFAMLYPLLGIAENSQA